MSSFSKSKLGLILLGCAFVTGCPVDERALTPRSSGGQAGTRSTAYAGLPNVGAQGGDGQGAEAGATGDAGSADMSTSGGGHGGSGGTAGGGTAGNVSGQAGGGVSGNAGEGGSGTDWGAGGCGDLDHNQVQDCDETLVENARFDSSDADWHADTLMAQAWDSRNARPGHASGSVAIVNASVAEAEGSVVGGSGQCLPAEGDLKYLVAARAFVPGGQGQGTASVAVWFYGADGCADYLLSSLGPPAVSATDTWVELSGVVKAPPATRSMRVALMASKPFKQTRLQVLFDDVLVREQ